jgi:hypothetical protein
LLGSRNGNAREQATQRAPLRVPRSSGPWPDAEAPARDEATQAPRPGAVKAAEERRTTNASPHPRGGSPRSGPRRPRELTEVR